MLIGEGKGGCTDTLEEFREDFRVIVEHFDIPTFPYMYDYLSIYEKIR